ncbi:SRPBCC family protein [Conexibacter arvalis]|uniref:Uncharacterized protein YndB with AHSA1/START domain n=1 Tax=Conexibacter arvalis TaxID=912552 RepID=A0A840I9Z6_9ACTN|nr:SRPBCC domain-containing protein [Conexibacter arvalis]MBB4660750.1 uncharacterized protein YndB with AHSA1/START domain [Conexibacter arvalis]
MTTTPDPPDARMVRVEVEVPATPEQVWEAIATGPGLAAWFVPAEVEECEGGEIVTHHGPFGDSRGVVTAWDPPRRFAYEEREWSEDADAPPWATEILVEARAGGTCVIRLASGFRSDGADWEDELAGTDEGWLDGMEHLRIYLTHFAGQPTSSVILFHALGDDADAAWRRMLGALALEDLAVGQRRAVAGTAPRLSGVVESVGPLQVKLRTDEPAPGIVDLAVHQRAGRTHAVVRGYLYGEAGQAARARAEEQWRSWLERQFPAAEPAERHG